jgi:8-amino-7-oxononanoate synthase
LGLKVLTGYLGHKDMDEDFLHKKIEERKAQNAYRQLRLPGNTIDFCSNDYLGVVKNGLLRFPEVNFRYGSTGSRLLAGNYALVEEMETSIAAFHQAEAGLIFNSGYDANIGLLSCVPQRGDTILYDYLSHASIRDGMRLSFAQSFSFLHNDLNDLEKKLTNAKGKLFVVTESVFSMDGDMAPLEAIAGLCKKYNAALIVDEAHATGVVGEKGEGLVQHLGLQQQCFARVHTFGKALGCHGAIVLGSDALRNYLVNFSRSFIYTTALPEISVGAVKASYQAFPFLIKEREHLETLINLFQSSVIAFEKLKSSTAIQAVLVPGNEKVKRLAAVCRQNNLDVRPILYPTVPKESERLRIVLHAFNMHTELELLVQLLSK